MTPDVSLYKVYVKCRLWLEMYELYLQTGKNISFHQFGEGSPASVTLDNSHFYTFYISTRFNKTFVDELNCRI